MDATLNRSYGPYMGGGHGFSSGGECPTFIQAREGGLRQESPSEPTAQALEGIISKISVPLSGAMLRSDIPIFGIAGGKDFRSYRVAVGVGAQPSNWEQIHSSITPQNSNDVGAAQVLYMQGDIDIRGNLATWNTGLKEWVHLPWHPPEEKVNYNGIHTIRLVVEGKDGKTVEDRVTCEVGRVIAQCLPGMATSPDQRVKMHFPEQALLNPFRIYSILPVSDAGGQTPPAPSGGSVIGQVYRIREPGDRFIKDVALEFTPDASLVGRQDPKNLGICRYDAEKKTWIWLPTTRDTKGSLFSATLSELPATKAIYALVSDRNAERSSIKPAVTQITAAVPLQPGVLVDDTFEKDLGTFKLRDRMVGATLSRDNKATPDGSYCLKLVNENFGGNFACTVLDQPFDARKFPVLSFDYRIGPGVKTDVLLKVNGRWYNLRFTETPVDYRNKDVNIANLGAIEGVVADDKWHTANVDLLHLLRKQTRHTQIDEIVMADWNVSGYMKLEFGSNPRGATFYLDNLRLSGTGMISEEPPVLFVDNFNDARSVNALGGQSGFYCNPGSRYLETAVVDLPPGPAQPVASSSNRNRALQLRFDMTQTDAYGGFWTSLQKRNLSGYGTIKFRLKSNGPVPTLEVGIRTTTGTEDKTMVATYASEPDKAGWREIQVPLRALRRLNDLGSPDVLFFAASRLTGSGKSEVLVDDVRFDQQDYSVVTGFEGLSKQDYAGQFTTHETGAAAISASLMSDLKAGTKSQNTVCRISYGGTIGRDYGSEGGFSYAYWQCSLNGIDARPFKYLSLRIRGDKGGETPNFYLNDGSRRVCLRAKEARPLTTVWQEIRLPLSFFGGRGIDLSCLESLQLTFEWNEQSGTVYVDDVQFGLDSTPGSLAAKNASGEPR